ncbi:MAG: hypothetical protein WBC04_25525 [Candidatus Acidiferrales bacterium]
MKNMLVPAILALLASLPSQAQVTVVNPDNLEVPKEKMNLLYANACRAVGEEFHVTKNSQIEFPVFLVLGESYEHISANNPPGVFRIYLQKWDEDKFTVSVISLALYNMLPLERRYKLAIEVRRRTDKIAPVTVSELRKPR